MIKNSLVLLLSIVCLSGCSEYLGGEFNQDPNEPASVPLPAHLPAIQIALADLTGGEFSRTNSSMMQQVEGIVRCCGVFAYQYDTFTPEFFNDAWQNLYEKIVVEIKIARQSASISGYNHYEGILDILEAYAMMMATDVWDDMPYSEAFQGIDNFNPAYDPQFAIYNAIHSLLDNSITKLSGSPGGLSPTYDDVYYNGDSERWIKAAHAVKARALLHEKKYEEAKTHALLSFTDESENLGYAYPGSGDAAPWYRFNRDRTGDVAFGTTMRTMLEELNDPDRLAVMDQPFDTYHTYLTPGFFVELITYREMQFLIAEIDVRTSPGGTQAGYEAYLSGIKASFERLELEEAVFDTYIAQPAIAPGAGNLTLEMVMIQKYIALFLHPEIYSDWRRTGIPDLTPAFGPAIPVRWNYSADEHAFNSNAPLESEIDIFQDKVGWNR